MKEAKAEGGRERGLTRGAFSIGWPGKAALAEGWGAASSKVPRPGGTGPVQGTYLKPVWPREAGQGPWG